MLVANRGEIAVRVLRTCRRLGIEGVLTVTEPSPVTARAVGRPRRGAGPSYLDVDAVVGGRRRDGCDALHPGYGFLSEKPALAAACDAAGVRFVGPSAATLPRRATSSLPAEHAVAGGRAGAAAAGADRRGARRSPREIGFPLLVKAAGGGGGARDAAGRGDRRRSPRRSSKPAPRRGRRSATDALYLERYVCPGGTSRCSCSATASGSIHLGDRDCSVQRRYQKLVEEAPAPQLGATLRADMRGRGGRARRAPRSTAAPGTVEFLVDAARSEFWFLEVNARIQVEHPVTEAVTGLDLVAEQIAIAEGRPCGCPRPASRLDGHAIECRINAEDPARRVPAQPRTRRPARSSRPGTGIRVDTHIQAGTAVPPQYDWLLAKLVVTARTGPRRWRVLRGALARCEIGGVATTLPVHAALAADASSPRGGVGTDYLARWLEPKPGPLGIEMAEIQLVDVSLRDGNQSLWGATGLRTAPHPADRPADRPGRVPGARLHSSTAMGVAVRTHREDPWERIRLTRAAMPRHAAAADRHRVPVHLLGAGPPGVDAAGLRAAGRGRHIAVRAARPDARHGRGAAQRADGQAGRRDRDRPGARRTRSAAFTTTLSTPGSPRATPRRPTSTASTSRTRPACSRPSAPRTLLPALRARARRHAAGAARAHHDRARRRWSTWRPPDLGVSVLQTGCGALADGVLAARRAAGGGEPARARPHRGRGRPAARARRRVFRGAGRGRGAADRRPQPIRRGVHPAPAGRRRDDHAAAPARRTGARRPVRRR